MSLSAWLGIIMAVSFGMLQCNRETVNEASNQPSGCLPALESVYVNNRYPDQIEPYNPDSARVFVFEQEFQDTVSVLIANKLIAKKHLQTQSNGLAAGVNINAQSNNEITITTNRSCTSFRLKDGYKYVYINQVQGREWTIAYSNFNRGYL